MTAIRLARDLRPLRNAPGLRTAAGAHSGAMLELGFFGHDSADGTAFSDRIRRYCPNRGYETWSVGEALIAGERPLTAKEIVQECLDSPPHREVILSRAWRESGFGALYALTDPHEYEGSEAVGVTADFGLCKGKPARS